MPSEAHAELAMHMMLPGSERMARIWEMVLSDEDDARLLLSMPGTAEALVAATGIPADDVNARVAELYHRGVVFEVVKPDGVVYRPPRHLIQMHDASVQWPEAPPEYRAAWKEFMAEEYHGWIHMVLGAGMPSFMRTVPAAASLQGLDGVLPQEDVEGMLGAAQTLAVCKCPCRSSELNCDNPIETCVQFDRGAEYAIKRGTGREISREEALKIVRDAAARGLVHTVENRAGLGNVLCNCCNDCCAIIKPFLEGGELRPILAPSRYRAAVDAPECTEDGLCADICPTGAIQLDDGASAAVVDEELCLGCGLCAAVCPANAVKLELVRGVEFIPA